MLSQGLVKTIGGNGQISLGKKYAGLQILIEEKDIGVWLIRTADVIPHNERWLHQPEQKTKLEAALAWATTHSASDAHVDDVIQSLQDGVAHEK